MNILVMGAGAMGSVFGAFLAEAGHHVHLVGREPHMAAVQEKGISVGGIWGEHLARNVAVHTSASQAHRDPFDLVLITTKAYDTERAAKEVKPLLGPGTLVVSIQNGLGNYEAISTQVGAERTIISRVIFGVDVVQEGRVEVTVHGGDCMLGNPAGAVVSIDGRELGVVPLSVPALEPGAGRARVVVVPRRRGRSQTRRRRRG